MITACVLLLSIATSLCPCVFSEETTDIMKFNCSLNNDLFIRNASFLENNTESLCDNNCMIKDKGKRHFVDCKKGETGKGKCIAQISPQGVIRIYQALDSGNQTTLTRIAKDLASLGQYKIGYECKNTRAAVVNPCNLAQRGKDKHAKAIIPKLEDPTASKKCSVICNITRIPPGTERFEYIFLLNDGASTENNRVSYQKVFQQKSEQERRELQNGVDFKKENIKAVQRMRLWIRLKSASSVLRFWLSFTPDGEFNVQCQDDVITTTTTKPPAVTDSPPTTTTTAGGIRPYIYLLPMILIGTVLAILLCIVLIRRRRKADSTKSDEIAALLHVPPSSTHHPPTTSHHPRDHRQSQEPDPSSDAPENEPHARVSLLRVPETGSGNDDGEYRRLDHDRVMWRTKRRGGDYSRLGLRQSAGDYDRVQREGRRRVVLDNPYDGAYVTED